MKSSKKPTRRQSPSRKKPIASAIAMMLSLSGCVIPDVVEKPKSEPTQAEKTACVKLAEYFPTWAYDGEPETAANRIDTKVSVEEGITFTGVFRAVCPGALPE